MNRHIADRRPRGRRIAWSRKLSMDGVLLTYTLWRRDNRGALHHYRLQYTPGIAPRRMIAGDLRRAWRVLREKVDEIDLAAMEVERG